MIEKVIAALARFALLALWMLAIGCTSRPVLTYVAQTDSDAQLKQEISPAHQQQIAEYLEYFYGSPVEPKLRDAKPESTSAETASSQPESEANAAKPKIAIPVSDRVDHLTLKLGREVYHRQCALCHGESGDGKGVAMVGENGEEKYLNPPPRDYRGATKTERATYKFTSTPLGGKPRREDLRRTLRFGAKGTSMPAFRFLPEEEREAVIDYVMHLSFRGEMELKLLSYVKSELTAEDKIDEATVAAIAREISASWDEAGPAVVRPVTVNPPKTEETIAAGAAAFAQMNCVKCHNRDARGSKTADVGYDNWGRIAFPADLTMGTLHGGRRPIDIYRRIYSGINGTPMPGSGQPDSSQGETAEQRSDKIWHLVHFVTTVIENNQIPPAQQKLIDEELARLKAVEAAAGAE
jgi:mono/diheme cytochrome c family protein